MTDDSKELPTDYRNIFQMALEMIQLLKQTADKTDCILANSVEKLLSDRANAPASSAETGELEGVHGLRFWEKPNQENATANSVNTEGKPRFYRLACTVMDRENPLLDSEQHFCCTTPDEADRAVGILNSLNAPPNSVVVSREQAEELQQFYIKAAKSAKSRARMKRNLSAGNADHLDAEASEYVTKTAELQAAIDGGAK